MKSNSNADDSSQEGDKAEQKGERKPASNDELLTDKKDKSEDKLRDDKPLEVQKMVSTGSNEDAPLKKPNDSDKKVNGYESRNEWVCGDLVWALISGHPFWPGIIITDPVLGLFKKTKKGRGDSVLNDFHVQFFGDKGSHCWVSAGRILNYFGETGLRSFAESKKRDKKYSSALPDGKGASAFKWKCAVKEADDAVAQSRKERIEYFEEYYPLKKPKLLVQTTKKEKSLNSTSASVEAAKEEVESESAPSKKRGRSDENKESDADDNFAATEKKQKKRNLPMKTQQKNKYKKKNSLAGKFEIFFEKSAPHFIELNSRFAVDEEALRRDLMKMWEVMNDEEKSKYSGYPMTFT